MIQSVVLQHLIGLLIEIVAGTSIDKQPKPPLQLFAVSESTTQLLKLVCSYEYFLFAFSAFVRPFTIQVRFDSDEITTTGTADMADANELSETPGGIIGFYLQYEQKTCT